MYAMIGGVCTLCGILSATLFSYIVPPLIAFVIGYALFLILSYVLNTRLTFKDSFGFKNFLKFCVAYMPSFVIQFLLAGVLITAFGQARIEVYTLTVIAGIPATFMLMRLYAFAKKRTVQPALTKD